MRRIWISFTAGWLMAGATGKARPLLTGADSGAGPQVNRFEGGSLTASFFAYAAGVTSGVRVAAGDVDGDGTADIITGTGSGVSSHVKVFSGTGLAEIRSFFAYTAAFTGGVYVAAGDVDGDGKTDIITGAGPGAGPHVKVFSGQTGAELRSFFAYGAFGGGVRVAAGDVNGDGRADIITGAGSSTGGHVKVFDGASGAEIRSFFAYAGFTGGVFVAAGDVNGDGRADIITGTDSGTAPHVKVFDGVNGATLRSFFAYAPTFTGGVRVAVGDVNNDGVNDIITGTGPGGPAHVKAFHGQTLAELQSFFAYAPTFTGGVFVAGGVAPPSPPQLEVDVFPKATGRLSLMLPNGNVENIVVTGRTTIEAQVPPTGAATDTDGDGLDQVELEIVDLELHGHSSLGAVTVRLNPARVATGEIEELVNTSVRHLDVPPFAGTGSAAAFFDVFTEVQLGGQTLHTATALHVQAKVSRKPAGEADNFERPDPVQPVNLLDANGNPTGYSIAQQTLTPDPGTRLDQFSWSLGKPNLIHPNGQTEAIVCGGASTIATCIRPGGVAADADADGFDEVQTELRQMNLAGTSSTGPVQIRLRPGTQSTGVIRELSNHTPGMLDLPPFAGTGTASSFFDVFFEIDVSGQTLVTASPLRMQAVMSSLPPASNESWMTLLLPGPVQLLDSNGNPTGLRIQSATYIPNPLQEHFFSDWQACFLIRLPNGAEANIDLTGTATVRAGILPDGTAADTDGDGLDQACAQLVDLHLTGSSPLGPATLTLAAFPSGAGGIEEQVNNKPGTLDVAPFTTAGSVQSFFDVFFEVNIGGMTLHNNVALHCNGAVTRVPPNPGEVLRSTAPVDLFDPNGSPTGVQLLRTVHIPVQTVPVSQLAGRSGMRVCRPATAPGHVLELSANLVQWQDSTLPESLMGGQICVDIPMTTDRRFVRLRKPAP